MGTSIEDSQKAIISQSDQYSNATSSGDTNNSSTTIAPSAATAAPATAAEATSASVSDADATQHHQINETLSQQTNTTTTTTQIPQVQEQRYSRPANYHHQHQHQHQHQSQPQQQAVPFAPYQLGLAQHLVYPPAPTSNTATHIYDSHQYPPAAAAASFYPHNLQPAASSLVAHALHQASYAATIYPTAAPPAGASYYIPFGQQPAFYTTAHHHTSTAQATTSAYQFHQYPALLAASTGHQNQHQHHHQQYSNLTNGTHNLVHTNASGQTDCARSASPVPSSLASSATSASAGTDPADKDDGALDDDEMPVRTKCPAKHAATAMAPDTYDSSALIAGANTWPPAGPSEYQAALVQPPPPTYYLASAASAATAVTPTGFLLMSTYPLIPHANYYADLMQQQCAQQNSLATGFPHQFYTHPSMMGAPSVHQPAAAAAAEVYMPPPATVAFSQFKAGSRVIPLLPIDAQATLTRQAYGMDNVWQDEFECLFSQFISSNVVWTLVEVETNPSIEESDKIIAYSGRYIVRARTLAQESSSPVSCSSEICCAGCEFSTSTSFDSTRQETDDSGNGQKVQSEHLVTSCDEKSSDVSPPDSADHAKGLPEISEKKEEKVSSSASDDSGEGDLRSVEAESDAENRDEQAQGVEEEEQGEGRNCEDLGEHDLPAVETTQEQCDNVAAEIESDCDSGAQVNSIDASSGSGGSCRSSGSGSHNDEQVTSTATETNPETSRSSSEPSRPQTVDRNETAATDESSPVGGHGPASRGHRREIVRRFRMFIDSAKVRFCCDHCGHGWTSMKGRVVFWYELFEIVDLPPQHQFNGKMMIGYCAYKLFGQQCDVCKIENRFERPMWYPEEVTKVLNNLYNKIGQVYFGFKMPAIDKQRRAGKPKTSHNSSLCQACHDGVCTDRK